MSDILTTRDGLIGNSPRYTNHISPPYQRFLKDDAGATINLTGVSPSAFTLTFVNQSNPLFVKSGTGTFTVVSPATQGLVSYQYSSGDVADAGNWYAFWTVQLAGEPSPRVFDPDFVSIILFPSVGGGGISVTIQDVNLTEVNGTAVSGSNPVPTSGPVTIADGANVAQGTTTDTSSANTTIGLLKAIKAYLGGTLATTVSSLPALPSGTNVIGHVIVDSAGSVSITSLPTLPTGTNVIGHVIIDSASNVSITSSIPAGSNTIGGVKLIDSAGTNVAGVDSSNNQLVKVNAALPAGTNVIGHVIVDSAGSVSVTSLPALPAGTNVIGHVIVDSGTITVNALPTGANTIGNVGLVAGAALVGTVEIADSAGTNKLTIDASGRLTLVPNQSINNAQIAGTTMSVNQGTADNGTQRVINAGAATGTKSNVASSASSGTILASNTSRKGAMVYNDSTQILYLDLSGGTASSTSYSLQIPANGFFELPAPVIYNGAITGIWAAANGSARVTEFS